MARRRDHRDRGDTVRRMLAWQEERMMLYRELSKVNEKLLADLMEEAIGPAADLIEQVEKDMGDLGMFDRSPKA